MGNCPSCHGGISSCRGHDVRPTDQPRERLCNGQSWWWVTPGRGAEGVSPLGSNGPKLLSSAPADDEDLARGGRAGKRVGGKACGREG